MGSLESGELQVAGAGEPPLTLMVSSSEPRESTGDGGPSTMPAARSGCTEAALAEDVAVTGGNWKALSALGRLMAVNGDVVRVGCEPPNVGKPGTIAEGVAAAEDASGFTLSGGGDVTSVAKSCENEKAVLEDDADVGV